MPSPPRHRAPPRRRGDTGGLIGGLLNAVAQIGTAVGIAVLLTVPGGRATAYLVAAGVVTVAVLGCAQRRRSSAVR